MREDHLDIVWMVFLCVSGAKTVKWLISLNGIVITDMICIDRTFEKTECVPNESAMNNRWRSYVGEHTGCIGNERILI